MLNVPTLWTAFVINFLALGLIWAYVMRSYPAFEAARFWAGSAFAAADHALYVAKKKGKNRHAVYELSPPLAPEPEALPDLALRRRA